MRKSDRTLIGVLVQRGDRLREGYCKEAIALTLEFSKRCDRLCKGHSEKAMSTTGYANALTLEFNQKGDRSYEGYSEKAIAPHLIGVERTIACIKVIANQRYFGGLHQCTIPEFSRRCDRTDKSYEN
ncbi:hypothetical protein LC607_26825 [Nostoc sp. CHAB 5824]|nr:hypothetical protein [Nostoc sp. CHAB 5824]